MAALVAGVKLVVESVAVKVQGAVPPSMTAALNVAVPAAAATEVVPARVHVEVRVIVSVKSFVATNPAPFSTDTWNDARATPAVPVVGGPPTKPTFEAVVG
jgi:hypothetical protein